MYVSEKIKTVIISSEITKSLHGHDQGEEMESLKRWVFSEWHFAAVFVGQKAATIIVTWSRAWVGRCQTTEHMSLAISSVLCAWLRMRRARQTDWCEEFAQLLSLSRNLLLLSKTCWGIVVSLIRSGRNWLLWVVDIIYQNNNFTGVIGQDGIAMHCSMNWHSGITSLERAHV